MNFHEYRQKLLNEDVENGVYTPDTLTKNELAGQASNISMERLIAKYFEKGKTGKVSMTGFGSDVAEGISNFMLEELVDPDSDFDSVDKFEAYKKAVRDKLSEKALPKLQEVFSQIGAIINNILTDYTKKI